METSHRDNKAEARNNTDSETLRRLPRKVVQELNQKATAALDNIIRRNTAGDVNYGGYDEAEIISAKALLDRNSTNP